MFSVASIAIVALVVTATGYNSSGGSPDTIVLSNGTLNDTSALPVTAPPQLPPTHRIVCIGDSITEGFADPNNWPYHLKARLGGDWEVIDQGVGGVFTADVLDLMDAALDVNPGFVIVAGGMNDLRNGVPLETMRVNIDAMCTRVESDGAVPVLCTVTPTSDRMERLDELNAWITQYAHVKGYDIIDFHAAINDKSNPGYADPALVSDGKHPNAAGYAAMGDVIDLAIFTKDKGSPQQSTTTTTTAAQNQTVAQYLTTTMQQLNFTVVTPFSEQSSTQAGVVVYNGTVSDQNGIYVVSVQACNTSQTAQAQFTSLQTMFIRQGYAQEQTTSTRWYGFNATTQRGTAVEYGTSPLIPHYCMVITGASTGQAPFQQTTWQREVVKVHETDSNGNGLGQAMGQGLSDVSRDQIQQQLHVDINDDDVDEGTGNSDTNGDSDSDTDNDDDD